MLLASFFIVGFSIVNIEILVPGWDYFPEKLIVDLSYLTS